MSTNDAGPQLLTPAAFDAAVEAQRSAYARRYPPTSPYEAWLQRELAVATVRLERFSQQETILLRVLAHRAEINWDQDQRVAAEERFALLRARPARVAAALQQSRHGCLLLIDRWTLLAAALDHHPEFTPAQRTLALDLLGIPAEFRDQSTPLDPPCPISPRAHLLDLIHDTINALEYAIHARLETLDSNAHHLATLGFFIQEEPPTLRNLRRQEAACSRHFHWLINELNRLRKSQPAPNSDAPPTSPPPPPTPPPTKITPLAPASPSPNTPPPLNRHARRTQQSQERRRPQ